jgi:hypothetical protein
MTLEDAILLYAPEGVLGLARQDRHEKLKTLLSVPFDPDLHYTMAYIHLHYAMLEIAEVILTHCNKEDETYKELEDFHNALEDCQRTNHSVFPLSVRHRHWWSGPHLFGKDIKDGMTAWFPLRVEFVEGDTFQAIVARKEDDRTVYGQVEIPCNRTITPPENDLMGEIVYHGEEYQIAFHLEKIWRHNPALQIVVNRAMPYITRSNEMLNQRIEEDLFGKKADNG